MLPEEEDTVSLNEIFKLLKCNLKGKNYALLWQIHEKTTLHYVQLIAVIFI